MLHGVAILILMAEILEALEAVMELELMVYLSTSLLMVTSSLTQVMQLV